MAILLIAFLLKIYNSHIKEPSLANDEFKKYISDKIPMVVGSFQCQESHDFNEGLKRLASLATNVEFDFPGLSRLIYAARNVLRNSYATQRSLILNEDAWESAILQIYEEQKESPKASSYDAFISKLFRFFVGTSLDLLNEHGQENINDTIQSLRIVVGEYLGKSPGGLLQASRLEKATKITPVQDDKTISNNLRQAERCFAKTVSQDSLLMLRQLSAQIEAR